MRLLLLLAATPAVVGAQGFRGTVRDVQSNRPVAGSLVTLLASDGRELRSVLSIDEGRYSIRAPGPGTYRLSAKRIGARRGITEPHQLADGEWKEIDIALDAILPTLPEVTVSAGMLCTTPSQYTRVAPLWDEVLTALSAASVSVRDSLYDVHIDRYTRSLEPRTLRVLGENREQYRGRVTTPFASVAPESLSAFGYWRQIGDTTTFYGVDVDVIQSEVFRRDHCFSLARARRDRPGQIGIAFDPAPSRRLPDIRGTLWLDSTTYELSMLEYAYTRLPRVEYIEQVSGQPHFERLVNGALDYGFSTSAGAICVSSAAWFDLGLLHASGRNPAAPA